MLRGAFRQIALTDQLLRPQQAPGAKCARGLCGGIMAEVSALGCGHCAGEHGWQSFQMHFQICRGRTGLGHGKNCQLANAYYLLAVGRLGSSAL